MAGTLDALYDYDSGQIDALCGAYRGAGPLQRPFYTSPDVFKADMERIWRRHWLYAGHACLIPNPGDWMTWAIGFELRDPVRAARTAKSAPSTTPAGIAARGSAARSMGTAAPSCAPITPGPTISTARCARRPSANSACTSQRSACIRCR